MNLALLTGRDDSFRAWEEFRDGFCAGARVVRECSVGWRGGSIRLDVHWHAGIRIWGVFRQEPPGEGGRFWNGFGVSEPDPGASLDITVEVNAPHEGEDRRAAGAFLRDDSNRFYVSHSGRIGGGRPGIGLTAFRKWSGQLPWTTIKTSKGTREMMVFGPFVPRKLPEKLGSFVWAVHEFKESVRSGTVSKASPYWRDAG